MKHLYKNRQNSHNKTALTIYWRGRRPLLNVCFIANCCTAVPDTVDKIHFIQRRCIDPIFPTPVSTIFIQDVPSILSFKPRILWCIRVKLSLIEYVGTCVQRSYLFFFLFLRRNGRRIYVKIHGWKEATLYISVNLAPSYKYLVREGELGRCEVSN